MNHGGDWRRVCAVYAHGLPKGQPRARARPFGKGVYDPGTADAWKSDVQRALLPHRPAAPIDTAVRVSVAFCLPRPRAFSARVRALFGGKSRNIPTGRVPHLGKPDRDNLDKAVLDAMVSMGFLRDDSVVCAGDISKWHAAEGEAPGAEIRIEEWRLSE